MPITLKTNAIKVKDSQGTYQSVDCIKGEPGEVTQAEFDNLSEDVNSLKSAINDKADVIISSASGDIASFDDGADGMPVKGLTVQIEPVQSGSGDPSPDNVRPIAGHTAVKVTRTGKNLLNDNKWKNGNNVYLGQEQSGYPVLLKPGTYTISVTSAVAVALYLKNASGVQTRLTPGSQTNSVVTFTVEQEDNYQIWAYASGLTTDGITEYQLELGTTATAYEPYSGQTYSITLPSDAGTVYGGTLDTVAGTLTVDSLLEVFDKVYQVDTRTGITSGINYAISGVTNVSTVGQYTRIGFGIDTKVDQTAYNRISSSYKHPISNMLKHYFTYNNQSAHWYRNTVLYAFFPTSLVGSTTQSVVDYLISIKDTNPFSVWIELATPLTYTLTPTQITTLLGSNRIWADTGSLSVDYCADTKTYVDESVPVQDVQVNGMSVLQDGVANVPMATKPLLPNNPGAFGVVRIGNFGVTTYNDTLCLDTPTDAMLKQGTSRDRAVTVFCQEKSTFYGLAKAAGSDEKNSTLPVGQYTESAKSAIHEMLNGSVSVSGTTPSITALPGVRYVCGEVATLNVTLPASGIVDVIFTSGSTPTVLTVTPPTGQTVKWANGFDPTALEANTTYEINILDGLGVVGTWT